jgi:hypothetical protein
MRAQCFVAMAAYELTCELQSLTDQLYAATTIPQHSPDNTAWLPHLADLAAGTAFWRYLLDSWGVATSALTVHGLSGGVRALLRDPVVVFGLKYGGVAVVLCVGTLLLMHLLPPGALSTTPLFAFITGAIVMRHQVSIVCVSQHVHTFTSWSGWNRVPSRLAFVSVFQLFL